MFINTLWEPQTTEYVSMHECKKKILCVFVGLVTVVSYNPNVVCNPGIIATKAIKTG
jgi:hypothetical protein